MKNVDVRDTRSFALIGHSHDGKTSLGEALLHATPNLSLAASLGISDDYDVVTLGARWNFRGR